MGGWDLTSHLNVLGGDGGPMCLALDGEGGGVLSLVLLIVGVTPSLCLPAFWVMRGGRRGNI